MLLCAAGGHREEDREAASEERVGGTKVGHVCFCYFFQCILCFFFISLFNFLRREILFDYEQYEYHGTSVSTLLKDYN